MKPSPSKMTFSGRVGTGVSEDETEDAKYEKFCI
jgi:hypothetical protein